MPSLETTFLGITYTNPFILASGPPTAKADMIIETFKAGWGGAVLKTIGLSPTLPPSPTQSRERYSSSIIEKSSGDCSPSGFKLFRKKLNPST